MDGMSGSHRMGKLRSLIAIATVMTVIAPPANAFWGKYGSRREAERACRAWLSEPSRAESIRIIDYARFYCLVETDTKQVMVIKAYIDGSQEKVVKRFRY